MTPMPVRPSQLYQEVDLITQIAVRVLPINQTLVDLECLAPFLDYRQDK